MESFKLPTILFIFALLIGVGFSHGLKFKKTTVEEEVIEYEEVVQKKIKRIKRVPSSEVPQYDKENPVTSSTNYSTGFTSHHEPPEQIENNEETPAVAGGGTEYVPMNESSPVRSQRGIRNPSSKSGTSSASKTSATSAQRGFTGGGYVPPVAASGTPVNQPSGTSSGASEKPQTVSLSITAISIKEGKLILKGKNLSGVKAISIKGDAVSGSLDKISQTASEIVAIGLTNVKLAAGKIYNIVISDAYASSTFPIEIELADGTVTPEKLAPLSASEDGYVLKWDASSEKWIAAPDEQGSGPGGGITSITKGAGLAGEGTSITTSGSIAVNVGNEANQIPQFDADKKLVLNDNVIELNETSSISFTENAEAFVFGMFSEVFKLRNQATNTTIFEVSGNNFLVTGKAVCLSDGTNCPTISGDSLSPAVDNSTIGLNGSNQLSVLNGGISAAKLSSMGAAPGQVLKWTAGGWVPSNDLNSGLASETDPKVRNFAHKDQAVPPTCDPHQTLSYVLLLDTFICQDIEFNSTQTDAMAAAAVADQINDGTTDVAPSQNAVFDALADKQEKITSTSDILMKYMKLMTDGSYWVGFKAPVATSGNLLFTLPASYGTSGQVLRTDGSGNLSWVSPNASLDDGGITNVKISPTAAISWSKIDKSGAVASDVGAVPTARTITSGVALSGGGDLSADRTLNVNVDNTTVAVNGTNQLSVKAGGITNTEISALATIDWGKISKIGAAPADVGAAPVGRNISTGTGLLGGGNLSADRTLSVDVGTTANKIVQLDTSGRLPAVDGSQLTNLGTNLGKWADATGGIQYSTGNVGIGTSTPATKLEVRTTTQDASASALRLTSSDGTFGVGQELQMDFNQNATVTSRMAMNYFAPDWGFNFYGFNAVLNPTPIVSMRGNGNVGIGTTNPLVKLHVQGSANADVGNYLINTDDTGNTSRAIVMVGTASTGYRYGYLSHHGAGYTASGAAKPRTTLLAGPDTGGLNLMANYGIGFWSGATETMKIDSSGQVGIGTSTPTAALEVNAPVANAFTTQFKLTDGVTGGFWSISEGATGANTYMPTFEFSSAGLAGYGGAIVGRIPAASDSNVSPGGAVILDGRSSSGNLANANILNIRNNGNSLAVVRPNGNMGLGTQAPATKLVVHGTNTATNFTTNNTTGLLTLLDTTTPSAVGVGPKIVFGSTYYNLGSTMPAASIGSFKEYGPTNGTSEYKHSLVFNTNDSGTGVAEKMRVTSAGKVGIGTDNPLVMLHVASSLSGGANDPTFMIENTVAGGKWMEMGVGTTGAVIDFAAAGSLVLRATTDKGNINNADSEIMRLTGTGNVGIGTQTPDEKFVVYNGSTTGKYTATGWTHSSDRRLKHEIKPLKGSLKKITQLQGVNYKFKKDNENKTQLGFIAQDVEPVFPEVVRTDEKGFKSMVYANLVAPLVEAVKELYGMIMELFERVETNSREISSIKEENKDLKVKNQELKSENEMIKTYLCQKDPSAPFCKK